MKLAKTSILLLSFLISTAALAGAEDKSDAAQNVDTLRLQLLEAEAKSGARKSRQTTRRRSQAGKYRTRVSRNWLNQAGRTARDATPPDRKSTRLNSSHRTQSR